MQLHITVFFGKIHFDLPLIHLPLPRESASYMKALWGLTEENEHTYER